MQIEMYSDIKDLTLQVKEIKFGATFTVIGRDKKNILLRVKPVNFLLNSNILNDMIHKDNVLVVNLYTGTCFIMNGETKVELVETILKVQ